MSKYDPLWIKVSNMDIDEHKLSFDEIGEVLSFPIDHSFLTYKKELNKYGYEVSKISLKEKWIIFRRIK